jgi:hypothetical protein
VPGLQLAAEQAMVDALTPETCAAAFHLASHLPLPHLMASAEKLALASFVEVAGSEGFASLPLPHLETLLAHDGLAAKEEQVFTALTRWVDAQPTPPTAAEEARLLALVRFPLITSEEFVVETVEASPLVARHTLILAQVAS